MSLFERSISNRALRWRLRFLISIFFVVAFVQSNKTVAATIAIDTGHSATEPGAISASGLAEYSFNKRVTRYMVQMLTEAGHRVIDIDALGSNLSLIERAQASKGASLLISLHHDSIQLAFLRAGRAREFSGFSVFVLNLNPYPLRSLRCAEGIGAALIARGARPSRYHADPIPG